MLSTLMIAASLSLAFPEVPVGPVKPPEEEVTEEQAQEVQDQLETEQAARDQAALEQAEKERAARSGGQVDRSGDRFSDDQRDWGYEDEKKKKSYDRFQLRALATTILPMRARDGSTGGEFLIGVRGELDVRRLSFLFSWDQGGVTPLSLSEPLADTSYWNGLLGASVWATKHSRVRVLGGMSALSTSREARFGPSIGTTVRLGVPVVSIEGAVIYTPVGFQQVDARGELVLRLLIFEARGGYRARWVDTSRSADRPVVEPTGGPTVSLGLIF
ncbi:MAG: hypothetical protein Q8N23_01450 [Archangium sp.]|nr:hypothetical protein [Archangium sp.]MDP3151303.1 hypothetical protein [Archangium sp.]MDP3571640.1 hypothetical protein [Archangium sp.]